MKLYPQINRQKGTLKVEVRILEPDAWLRPDMSVRINFLEPVQGGEGEAAAVLTPREALRSDAEGPFVWVVSRGRLRRQSVQTAGAASGNQVVVSAGLSGGEALVIGDSEGLREGQAVRIASP